MSDRWFVSILESQGYRQGDCQDVYLRMELDRELDQPKVGPDHTVREFKGESEIAQRAGAQWHTHVDETEASAWATDNTGRMIEHQVGRDDFDLVASSGDGTILSYAYCSIDFITGGGEFEMVGTRLSHRRRGLSRAVLLTGLNKMKTMGMAFAVVRTEAGNEPAQRLYQSLGFQLVDQLHAFVKNP